MNKKLFLLPLLVLGLAGCGEEPAPAPTPTPACEHVDVNPKDHKCDKCGAVLSQHSDANHDHLCDYCGAKISDHSYTYDADNKHKCECGDTQNCVDADNNGKCDVCGHEEEKPVVGEPFKLDYDSVPGLSDMGDGYTYFLDVVEFEEGGAQWATSPKGADGKGTFGRPAPQYNPGWGEFKVMQFKANGAGYIANTTGITGFTKMTVSWYATYNAEDTKYFPIISQGPKATDLSPVACNQTEKMTGVDTGKTDGSTDNKKIYKYETTYTLNSAYGYFKLAGGASATFIASFSFEK